MSDEIQAQYTSGVTLYAIIRNPAAQVWNGSSFEVYSASNWTSYDVTMGEQGSSGYYTGDFPTGITSAGGYRTVVYEQAGGTPDETDTAVASGVIYWDGVQEIDLIDLSDMFILDSVNDASPAANGFDGSSSLSAVDDFYIGSVLVFVTGAMQGVARKITSYTGVTRTFAFTGDLGDADEPFPVAPSDGDAFKVLGRIG